MRHETIQTHNPFGFEKGNASNPKLPKTLGCLNQHDKSPYIYCNFIWFNFICMPHVIKYTIYTFRFTMVQTLWASFFAVQFYSTKSQMEQCCRRRFVKYSSAVSWRLTKQRPSLCVSDELKYVAIPKDRKLQMSRFRTQSLRSKIASCSRTFSDSALCSKLRMAFAGRKETSVRPEQQNSTNKLDSRWMLSSPQRMLKNPIHPPSLRWPCAKILDTTRLQSEEFLEPLSPLPGKGSAAWAGRREQKSVQWGYQLRTSLQDVAAPNPHLASVVMDVMASPQCDTSAQYSILALTYVIIRPKAVGISIMGNPFRGPIMLGTAL